MESVTPQPKTQPKPKPQPKSTKSTKKILSVIDNKPAALSEEERNARVAVLAYYKAQARRFEPGSQLADWLAAEAEVNQ